MYLGCGNTYIGPFVWFLSGLSKNIPPPEPELPEVPSRGPPRFQPDGEKQEHSSHLPANASKGNEGNKVNVSPNSQATSVAGPQTRKCSPMIQVASQKVL